MKVCTHLCNKPLNTIWRTKEQRNVAMWRHDNVHACTLTCMCTHACKCVHAWTLLLYLPFVTVFKGCSTFLDKGCLLNLWSRQNITSLFKWRYTLSLTMASMHVTCCNTSGKNLWGTLFNFFFQIQTIMDKTNETPLFPQPMLTNSDHQASRKLSPLHVLDVTPLGHAFFTIKSRALAPPPTPYQC